MSMLLLRPPSLPCSHATALPAACMPPAPLTTCFLTKSACPAGYCTTIFYCTINAQVLALVDGERKLLMQGSGASPEGNR